MAYEGKFTDKSPSLRPAGLISFRKNEDVGSCLVHEVTENEDHPFLRKASLSDYKLPPNKTNIYKGFYSDVRDCLQPHVEEGFFTVLSREFQDTVYDSYWKKPLGRVADQVPNLPAGMDYRNVCFGKVTPKDISAGKLKNPPKPFAAVLEEGEVGHEMYKNSHQDFHPEEQIRRNYVTPFDRDRVWGKSTPSDPQGGCLKTVMSTDVDETTLVSKILADHRIRTKPQLGKVFAPNNNIDCVPENHTFGRLNKRAAFGVGELLKDCPPNFDKLDLFEQIAHVNVIRQQIGKRQPPFPHRDLIDAFHQVDDANTGYLDLKDVYEVLVQYQIFPDRPVFEGLLRRLNILDDKRIVAYESAADLLNVNVLFPDLDKLEDIPKEFMYLETSNQLAQKYHCSDYTNTEGIPKAGIPPKSYVSVESIVSPSIFTNYGLEPKDFFTSKSREFFQTLIHRIGCYTDEDTFDMTWEAAKDQNGCVCIQSFFNAWTILKNKI